MRLVQSVFSCDRSSKNHYFLKDRFWHTFHMHIRRTKICARTSTKIQIGKFIYNHSFIWTKNQSLLSVVTHNLNININQGHKTVCFVFLTACLWWKDIPLIQLNQYEGAWRNTANHFSDLTWNNTSARLLFFTLV